MEHRKINTAAKVSNDNAIQQANQIRDRLESALRLVDQLTGTRPPASVTRSQSITEQSLRALLKLRRNRAHFFDDELFADPAWDILLELYAAELGQLRVSVTSLCVSAAVPSTTALRWIGHLERKNLINRRADPMDGRRFFVTLSTDGLRALEDFFRTVPAGLPII